MKKVIEMNYEGVARYLAASYSPSENQDFVTWAHFENAINILDRIKRVVFPDGQSTLQAAIDVLKAELDNSGKEVERFIHDSSKNDGRDENGY